MGWGWRVSCLAPRTRHPPRLPLWLRYSPGLKLPNPLVASDRLFLMLMPGRASSSWGAGQREMLYPNEFVTSRCQGDLRGGCGAFVSRCKGDGKGAPVPPARLLGSSSPDRPGPTAAREVCFCSLPSATPKDPPPGSTQTGCNRDPALICFADNLFSGSH